MKLNLTKKQKEQQKILENLKVEVWHTQPCIPDCRTCGATYPIGERCADKMYKCKYNFVLPADLNKPVDVCTGIWYYNFIGHALI